MDPGSKKVKKQWGTDEDPLAPEEPQAPAEDDVW